MTNKLIDQFQYRDTIVCEDLLKYSLDLYERALTLVMTYEPQVHGDEIPAWEQFNLSNGIIETYYEQNPGFDYRDIRDGRFTSEQLRTLQNIQADKESRLASQERIKIKRYRGY